MSRVEMLHHAAIAIAARLAVPIRDVHGDWVHHSPKGAAEVAKIRAQALVEAFEVEESEEAT